MEILRWHLRKEGDSKYTLKFIILRALRSREDSAHPSPQSPLSLLSVLPQVLLPTHVSPLALVPFIPLLSLSPVPPRLPFTFFSPPCLNHFSFLLFLVSLSYTQN